MSPETIVRRFRIVAGKHHTGKGIVYKAGDVLESTRPLDKIFINKFVEVADASPVTAAADPDGLPPPKWTGPVDKTVAEKQILESRILSLTKVNADLHNENQRLRDELEAASSRLAASDEASTLAAAKKTPKGAPKKDPFTE